MGMFLPETAPTSPVATVTPQAGVASDADLMLMQKVFDAAVARPDLIPEGFMAYMQDFIQTSRLSIPIGQIVGFSQFVAQLAAVEAEQSFTSSAYAAPASPIQLTKLGNGTYVVLFGAAMEGDDASTGSTVHLGVSINGAAPATYAESTTQGTYVSGARGVTAKLTGGNSTLSLKGLTSINGHTSKIREAWILALKIANA